MNEEKEKRQLNIAIAYRLQLIRELMGQTQYEFARFANVNTGQYVKIENYFYDDLFDRQVLIKIGAALGRNAFSVFPELDRFNALARAERRSNEEVLHD